MGDGENVRKEHMIKEKQRIGVGKRTVGYYFILN